jgi:hypothetical protein
MVKAHIKNKRGLVKALVQAWRETAKDVFDLTQEYVPVKSGDLKRTGKIKDIRDGSVITYGDKKKVYYAKKQEEGIPPGGTEEVPRHIVKAHQRKTRSGSVIKVKKRIVEPYTKTYPNGYPGKFFVERSYEKFKPKFAAIFKSHLPG